VKIPAPLENIDFDRAIASQVEGSKANAALLARVQALREARARRDLLLEQKARLHASCSEMERFATRTKQQVAEARRAAHGVTPQGKHSNGKTSMR
jgi:hypothetical protein